MWNEAEEYKGIRYRKNQKIVIYNSGKIHSIENDPEITQMTEFVDKDIKRIPNCILYVQNTRGKMENVK